MEEDFDGGGRWGLTEESPRNEGTGLEGKVDGSLERHELKDVITLENLSLKRFAIFAKLGNGCNIAVSKADI